MSGMEPIAALGLSCNILQVVGVGRETVRLAKNVYQDGELDPALKESAELLRDISEAIRTTTTSVASNSQSAQAPAARDKQLLGLVDKCQGAARDLDEEVKFLHGVPGGKAKLVAALKVAAKTTWRKRRLDNLDRKLKEAEAHLQTGLLARIFERTEKTGIDLSALDADLRSFVQEYRKGHTDTAKLVSTESIQTRKHVSVEVKQSEVAIRSHITQHAIQSEKSLRTQIGAVLVGASQRNKDIQLQARREKLLGSLKFDRINERRNLVETSHSGTCSWVLEDGSDESESRVKSSTSEDDFDSEREDDSDNENELDHNSRSTFSDTDSSYEGNLSTGPDFEWDSFSDWLRSNEKVYWISGKPGSGKSTLMKYILRDTRTSHFLHLWSPNPVLMSHFFWRPGSEMQQSIRGLLCSLLYQLLSHDTPCLDRLLDTSSDVAFKDSDTDWSAEELEATLHNVINIFPQPIALFLDGLDEVLPSDGPIRLLNMIDQLKDLNARVGIKLCLGSRREPILQMRLGIYPQLRLENLNFADLQKYAMENIEVPLNYHIGLPEGLQLRHNGMVITRDDMPNKTDIKKWLVYELTEKAEGVFLWLCLTTKTVNTAIVSGETIEDLVHRIDRLPKDLSQLYTEMWARNNADDTDHLKSRAAVYFRLALTVATFGSRLNTIFWLTPFTLAIATQPELASLCFDTSKSKEGLAGRLLEASMAMKRDVEARCFGLLECRQFGEPPLGSMFPWHGDEFVKLAPYVRPSEDSNTALLHASVGRQHEFLRYSVFVIAKLRWAWEMPYELLFDMAKTRDLDDDTKSDFLYYALDHFPLRYDRFGPVECLVEWGYSPTARKKYRQPWTYPGEEVLETPLKFFLESKCWTLTELQYCNPIELQTSVDILKLFLTLGADLDEEIHVLFEFSEGMMRTEAWRNSKSNCIGMVIGYEASAIVGTLIQQWGFESHEHWAALAEGHDLFKGMVGQGRLIAIMHFPHHMSLHNFSKLNPYPLEPEEDPDEDMLQLMRLAELGLVEANGSPVLISPEMQACLDRGFKRMSSTDVPLAERQRLFRRRMNIFPEES
ncbi:hypothetical protein MCOR25_005059 [Pyricularia grisea]|nr:hypothetical protein MCOR25_005059 [Pyricularia grisea]